jgi:hypothetical protein
MLQYRHGMRDTFDQISKYVLLRNAWWGDTSRATFTPRVTVKGVHNDIAVDCAEQAAAAFTGALWPNAQESFEVVPHPLMATSPEMKKLLRKKDVKAYYEEVTQRARQPFANEECGWSTAFAEHIHEQITLGTSGIVGEEDEYDLVNPCYFRAASIETCLIAEGDRNRIDSVAFEYSWTVSQVVERYGLKNCSDEVQRKYNVIENQEDIVRVLHIIYPRPQGRRGAPKINKAWASIHMELDTDNILKVDGLDRLTTWISRFRKRPGEVYGRSLAMNAMPTIREANLITASMNKALGLHYGPPVGIRADQFGNIDTVDLGMDGKNMLITSKGMVESTRPPVEKLIDVPEPRVGNERMNQIEERIMVKFLLDKLLDFNNKTRMTLGEVRVRTDFRNQALGNYFARQMSEVLHPAIMWVLDVLWRRNMLGFHPIRDAVLITHMKNDGVIPLVMPKVVADFWDATGKLPFAVRFCSPAARAMAADSQQGIEQLTNFVMAMVNGGAADALDNLDIDNTVELYAHHVGAPPAVLRASDDRDQARQARQQAQAQMADLQAQEQQSTIQKNQAKAAKDAAQAGGLAFGTT